MCRPALNTAAAQAMHYLDPDSFEAEGPGVSADEVTQLGHAFIPCLLNRYPHDITKHNSLESFITPNCPRLQTYSFEA